MDPAPRQKGHVKRAQSHKARKLCLRWSCRRSLAESANLRSEPGSRIRQSPVERNGPEALLKRVDQRPLAARELEVSRRVALE